MKLDSIIHSNNALKKNGYQIVRKLHKLERKKNLDCVYELTYEGIPFWFLSFKNLVDIIKTMYGASKEEYISIFIKKSESFQSYLEKVAVRRGKINGSRLSSYLKAYTQFFNRAKQTEKFDKSLKVLEEWNLKCVMAYYAAWKK